MQIKSQYQKPVSNRAKDMDTRQSDAAGKIGRPKVESWFTLATRRDVVHRAFVMAVIVGTVLVLINHSSCVMKGMFGKVCMIQSILTYFVPYGVSTVSSVMALGRKSK